MKSTIKQTLNPTVMKAILLKKIWKMHIVAKKNG